jgi:hypothetical protein
MQTVAILVFIALAEGAPKAPPTTPKLLLGRYYGSMRSIESPERKLYVLDCLPYSGLDTTLRLGSSGYLM